MPKLEKVRVKRLTARHIFGVECRSCGYGVGLVNVDAAPETFEIECTMCGAEATYSKGDIHALDVVRKH